jgi:hypothetical protein
MRAYYPVGSKTVTREATYMITNPGSGTRIDEIVDGIYRISPRA